MGPGVTWREPSVRRLLPNILICSSLLLSCCLHAMVPLGRQSPLLALSLPCGWWQCQVCMPPSPPAHILMQTSGKIAPSSIPLRWLHLGLRSSEPRTSGLCCVLVSPQSCRSWAGVPSQGTGAVPDPEHRALQGTVLGTAGGSGSWLLVPAYSCTFPAQLYCREGWALDEVVDVGLGLSEALL